MRRFNLKRVEDETGISGTGIVTEGVEFSDGTCVMLWLTATSSVAFYKNAQELLIIHGHNGRTLFEGIDDPEYWKQVNAEYLAGVDEGSRFC